MRKNFHTELGLAASPHPMTPERALTVINCMVWDGEIRTAHDAADALIDTLVAVGADRVRDGEAVFYQALGVRSTLAAILGRADRKRRERELRPFRAKKAASRPAASSPRARRSK